MKVGVLQQAMYRGLPAGFEKRYSSCVTTPYSELVDPDTMYATYGWHIDELLLALRSGFDGVAVTEHGQAAYDIAPNPSLFGSILAYAMREEEIDAALILLGRSLGKTREPLRIAEEYAMLDVLSGGRLVAGFPVGLSYDANLNNGIAPVETRERFREGYKLVKKAWTADEPFAWNGRFSQYQNVNPWPRPLQDPHPPVWVPGAGTPGTMAWTLEENAVFAYLSWFGPTATASRIFGRYWEIAEQQGQPANPYRLAFTQVCAVAETDARAEQEYGPYLETAFRQGVGSIPLNYFALPGYIDRPGVEALLRDPGDLGIAPKLNSATIGQLIETQAAIVGSPATVVDRITAFVKEFRIGNLLVMLHMGGMPHELVVKNVNLFAEEVLPQLRQIWADEGWEHGWWPTGIGRRAAAPVA